MPPLVPTTTRSASPLLGCALNVGFVEVNGIFFCNLRWSERPISVLVKQGRA